MKPLESYFKQLKNDLAKISTPEKAEELYYNFIMICFIVAEM